MYGIGISTGLYRDIYCIVYGYLFDGIGISTVWYKDIC
jgi:hypothetical protein